MTHFKIVCTGWKNWPWIKQTLASIDQQVYRDFDVCVVDDASNDKQLQNFIPLYCFERGWRWVMQREHKGALFNQVAAIRLMDPDPEDVIVFLDPDGDRFTHEEVLDRLNDAYVDDTRLAYSLYETDPPSPTSNQSRPYPDWVLKEGSYRKFTRDHGIFWNHLRTFKAELFLMLDDGDFVDDGGRWWSVADAALMFPCLELARGKVKFIPEVLLTYRADYELSDWRRFPNEIDQDTQSILRRPPK